MRYVECMRARRPGDSSAQSDRAGKEKQLHPLVE
jgi:hypothetical protein